MKFIVAGITGLILLISLPGSCFLSPVSSSSDPCLIIVGGGHIPDELKSEFVRRSNGRIIVIPNASGRKEAGNEEIELWKNSSIAIRYPLSAIRVYTCPDDIRKTNAVWIGGGDQRRLNKMEKRDRLIYELKSLLKRGGIVGGTSAGASIMGSIMPVEDGEENGWGLIEEINDSSGVSRLAFGVCIDQHFIVRNRLGRLQKIVNNHSGYRGYGIDESAGIMIVGRRVRFYGQVVVLR
jgi:cyanophycinase